MLFVGYLMHVDVLMYNDVFSNIQVFHFKKKCSFPTNVFCMLDILNKKISTSIAGGGHRLSAV